MANRYYKPNTLNCAKNLRQNQTDSENVLWFNIRNNQISGIKFRRQVPIGKYIVDFVCLKKKLIIELDGSQHIDNKIYDEERSNYLKANGYTILRFNNDDVLKNTQDVLQTIYDKYLNL